ncbi:hypothetical protein [Mesorhizobium sp. J8]|uniref:hypothetical protein n=1 Tax=Mesorhizobium sp. J8 TaxID=2777475 RepID=UPI001CD8FF4E|nr:hypothetical protein [Mesorhizobium sp. J8]
MPIRRQWFSVMRTDHVMSPAMATFNDFLMRKGATYLPLLGKLYPRAEADEAARTQQARAPGTRRG